MLGIEYGHWALVNFFGVFVISFLSLVLPEVLFSIFFPGGGGGQMLEI